MDADQLDRGSVVRRKRSQLPPSTAARTSGGTTPPTLTRSATESISVGV